MAEAYYADLGRSLEGVTVAIQGFGNVGSYAALFAHQRGAKVLAVSDVSGTVSHPSVLDIPALAAHFAASAGMRLHGVPLTTARTDGGSKSIPIEIPVSQRVAEMHCKYS